MGALLQYLRQATAEAHEALHHHPTLEKLTEAGVTKDYYLNALSGFYGFYKPLETAFEKSDRSNLTEFDAARATIALENDLNHHGIDPCRLPLWDDAPESMSLSQSIGFLYLREGSTLGGQGISKSLEKHLDLKPEQNNRFFHGYGRETGPRWKTFQKKLLDLENQVDHDAASGFAANLFSNLYNWLNR